jgi:hypothetical protein
MEMQRVSRGDMGRGRIADGYTEGFVMATLPATMAVIQLFLGAHCPCTVSPPSNILNGQTLTLEVHQDSTGHRMLQWDELFVVPKGDWKPLIPAQSPGAVSMYNLYALDKRRMMVMLSGKFSAQDWARMRENQSRYEGLVRYEHRGQK